MATEPPNAAFTTDPFDQQAIDPPKKKGNLLVLLAGVATSALTLAIVWYVNWNFGFDPMGWYLMFILPAGAIFVGAAAGSGYGLASWLRGVKINGWLLFLVVCLQLMCYFEAQYLDYKLLMNANPGANVTFFEYYDTITRDIRFDENGPGFGAWGYAFRLLEMVGFVVGAVAVPLIVGKSHYCETCQAYMRSRSLALLPAGVIPRKLKKKDVDGTQQYEQEVQSSIQQGLEMTGSLAERATNGDAAGFIELVRPHVPNRKQNDKLTTRIDLTLARCPGCDRGILTAVLIAGQGEDAKREDVLQAEVEPEFVRAVSRELG